MAERWLAALAVVPFLLGAAAAPTSETTVVTSFQDPEISESSGLVVDGDVAYTVNDSGNAGRVYTVSLETGETVGTTDFAVDPTDVEALAPAGPGAVWVGDIGDNLERRESVSVTKVRIGTDGGTAYELTYPDGAHDAETLLSDPANGRLYVATKSVLGGTLYAAPARLDPDGPNELEPVGDVLPIATDGTFLPGGTELVIRNYSAATLYAFPSLEKLESFPLPDQEQGEGIGVLPDGDLLLSSEGVGADLLRVALPEPSPSAAPTPSTSSAAEPTSAPPTFTTESREDRELPETTETQRSAWPWFLGGFLGLGVILVLTRSMRPR